MPESRDAWMALWRLEDLALVETMTGETDAALAGLEHLVKTAGEISPNVLRIDPRWEPLRAQPRFAALTAPSPR
jgi:hypothetical protein